MKQQKKLKITIPKDSIWHKYKDLVKGSRERGQVLKNNRNPEPPDFLLLEDQESELDFIEYYSPEDGTVYNDDLSSKFGYFLSVEWVSNLLGAKWEDLVQKLNINKRYMPMSAHGTFYYHEIYIEKIVEVLIQIIDNDNIMYLRRRPLIPELLQKDIYTSDDMMKILNVGESTLRAYRDNRLLNFSREGDKIWYTKENIMKFMENTSCNN